MASFALSYAMADLGWKFYLINASYNIVFFIIIYLTWVETKGVPLEEIALKFEGTTAFADTDIPTISGQAPNVKHDQTTDIKQVKSDLA